MGLNVTVSAGGTPPGLYLFALKAIEETTGTNFTTKLPEPQFKWIWEVKRVLELEPSLEQEEAVGREHWEWSSTTVTPGSKAGARFAALLGRPVAVGENIEVDDLIGKGIKATVAVYEKKTGGQAVGVVSVQPYARPQANRPAQPAQRPGQRPAASASATAEADEDLPF